MPERISRRRHRRVLVAGVAVMAMLLGVAACTGSSNPPLSSAAITSSGGAAAENASSIAAGSAIATFDGSPSGQAPTAAEFQATIDRVRADVGFPGAMVGVWGPGAATWVGTTGTAEKGTERAVTGKDHTRVGSLTKTMTATVLLQLLQEKKLSLDDPISKYVDGLPNGEASLRQLADMTSGIPIYTAQPTFLPTIVADPSKGWTPNELLSFIKGVEPDFAPGTKWEYNNTNYLLLGMAIEKVTGRPIAEVFKERLFDPLGMNDTFFPGPTTEIPSPYLSGITAQGQAAGITVDSTHWNPSFAFTAGEVVSTFDDLKKWADALFTGQGILDADTQKLRLDSTTADPITNGYGFGIGDMGGWWGHNGQIFGYTTSVFHHYDLDITIVIVTNSDAPQPGTEDKPVVAAPALLHALQTLVS